MKKALCIGINNYPGFTNDLKGCVNDANDWEVILAHAGFLVDKVIDSEATRKTILKKLETLITSAQPDDELVFTYSGHGTSVTDKNSDEADGYDEALVAYDGNIVDDELRAVLQKAQPGMHIVVIADSCFSGTVTRALMSDKARPRYLITEKIPSTARRKKKLLSDEDMVEMLITGCSDSEYSYDAEIDGRWNGAMTAYATSVLKSGQTYNEFYQKLRTLLPSDDFPQTPQLEGSAENKNRSVFATNEEPLPRPDPVQTGGLWGWIQKYWWIVVLIIVAMIVLRRVL